MFLDDFEPMDAKVSYFKRFGGQPDGKAPSGWGRFYRFRAVREPLKEGTDLYTVTLSADLWLVDKDRDLQWMYTVYSDLSFSTVGIVDRYDPRSR